MMNRKVILMLLAIFFTVSCSNTNKNKIFEFKPVNFDEIKMDRIVSEQKSNESLPDDFEIYNKNYKVSKNMNVCKDDNITVFDTTSNIVIKSYKTNNENLLNYKAYKIVNNKCEKIGDLKDVNAFAIKYASNSEKMIISVVTNKSKPDMIGEIYEISNFGIKKIIDTSSLVIDLNIYDNKVLYTDYEYINDDTVVSKMVVYDLIKQSKKEIKSLDKININKIYTVNNEIHIYMEDAEKQMGYVYVYENKVLFENYNINNPTKKYQLDNIKDISFTGIEQKGDYIYFYGGLFGVCDLGYSNCETFILKDKFENASIISYIDDYAIFSVESENKKNKGTYLYDIKNNSIDKILDSNDNSQWFYYNKKITVLINNNKGKNKTISYKLK